MARTTNLFVYGTLLFPAILQGICGRTFAATAARLPDYACRRMRDLPYPGLTAASGSICRGIVYADVDPASIELLDRYEGTIYRRLAVTVETGDGEMLAAETYVVAATHQHLLTDQPWSPEEFARCHLQAYLLRL